MPSDAMDILFSQPFKLQWRRATLLSIRFISDQGPGSTVPSNFDACTDQCSLLSAPFLLVV
jgi:hypothetical protein